MIEILIFLALFLVITTKARKGIGHRNSVMEEHHPLPMKKMNDEFKDKLRELKAQARERRRGLPLLKRFREWLANVLLLEIHLYRTHFGLRSVTLGDMITFSGSTAPSATGEFNYVSGDMQWYDGTDVYTALHNAPDNASQSVAGDLGFGDTYNVTGLAAPSAGADAANKTYVDNAINGLAWKDSVRCRATGNVDLSSELENGDTIDTSVTLVTGDRVLCDQQSSPTEDGIYVAVASGAASRSADAQTGEEFAGVAIFVEEGTAYGDQGFVCTNDDGADVVGTDNLAFTQFTGGAPTYEAPGLTYGTSNADGSGNSIRSGATIDVFDATVPGTVAPGDTAAAGVVGQAARRDHEHGVSVAAPTIALGASAAEGTGTSFIRDDATIQAFDDAGGDPNTIEPDDVAVDGTANYAARQDHEHAIVTDAPSTNLTPTTTNAEGSGTSFARNDHTHAVDAGTPNAIQPDDTAAEGTGASFARNDHTHSIVAAAPGAGSVNIAASGEGSGTDFARADHTHNLDETIAPTWTGKHQFRVGASGTAVELGNQASDDVDIVPFTDQFCSVGTSSKRLKEVNAVTIKSGDVELQNGWKITELWEDGEVGFRQDPDEMKSIGVAILGKDGEPMFEVREDGMYFRGRKVQLT